MNVSISRLRDIVAAGEASREWPGRVASILGVYQGDYDWTDETSAAIHAALELDGEVPLEELLPSLDEPLWGERYPQYYAPHLFFVASLLAASRSGDWPPEERVSGDLHVAERRVVLGDLRVDGDATFGSELVVLGDLHVGGRLLLEDTWSAVAVVGNLSVDQDLLIRSMTYVGGDVRAEKVLVDNPDYVGSLHACGDLHAGLLAEAIAPDSRSVVYGSSHLSEPTIANAIELIAATFSR